MLDTLRSGNRHGFFDNVALHGLTDAFYRGNNSRDHQIWALYAFEVWYRDVHCAADPRLVADAA